MNLFSTYGQQSDLTSCTQQDLLYYHGWLNTHKLNMQPAVALLLEHCLCIITARFWKEVSFQPDSRRSSLIFKATLHFACWAPENLAMILFYSTTLLTIAHGNILTMRSSDISYDPIFCFPWRRISSGWKGKNILQCCRKLGSWWYLLLCSYELSISDVC